MEEQQNNDQLQQQKMSSNNDSSTNSGPDNVRSEDGQSQSQFSAPQSQPEQSQFPSQSEQPQPQQQQINLPPSDNDSADPFASNSDSKKWVGLVALVVLVAAVLYFTGFWQWMGGWLTGSNSQPAQPQEELVNSNNEEPSQESLIPPSREEEGVGNEQQPAIPGKGDVSLVVSAGVVQGAVLTKGESRPNVEIREVSLYNPAKKEWLLLYKGIRPLDLLQLSASREEHELIATSLAAINYTKVRVKLTDLVRVDKKGEQSISRDRLEELESNINIAEGKDNTINLWFDVSDAERPVLKRVVVNTAE